MKYQYGEYQGPPFPTPDSLFPDHRVMQFILLHGEAALEAMSHLQDEDQQAYIEAMVQAGLLERDEETGALRMTPRMLRGLEHHALLEIFEGLRQGRREGHETQDRGRSSERATGSRPYEYGDPLSELDLAATLRNAVQRLGAADRSPAGGIPSSPSPPGFAGGEGRGEGGEDLGPPTRKISLNPAHSASPPQFRGSGGRGAGNATGSLSASASAGDPGTGSKLAMSRPPSPLPSPPAKPGGEGVPGSVALPLRLQAGDFEVFLTEGQSDCATCLLIDMSGSMMRWGRFYHAKRVALGMQALVRGRFPQDTLDFVGFHSLADRLVESQLPLVMPKPVTVHDHQVRLRVPLEQARANPRRIPRHFTNLQLGLRLARQILARRGAANKQIFIITDGQPTAHIESSGGVGEETLCLLYPPSERTATITLKEALRCQQMGIRIATFALIEDYWGMDWVGFVDRLTRLTHGIAYYCSSDDLSSTVIESYLSGKKRKSFVG